MKEVIEPILPEKRESLKKAHKKDDRIILNTTSNNEDYENEVITKEAKRNKTKKSKTDINEKVEQNKETKQESKKKRGRPRKVV